MPLTAKERTLRARKAAHAKHAKHDSRQSTEAAFAATMRKFEAQADPAHLLPDDERRRIAGHLLRAHLAGLSLKSSIARRRKADQLAGATP